MAVPEATARIPSSRGQVSAALGNPSEGAPAWELPVEAYRLANGIDVVLQPDPRSPVAVVHLGLGSGSASDPAGLSGLAHLSEHLAYAGLAAGRLRSYPPLVHSRGGIPGAFTFYDRSHFFEVLPAGQLLTGLWLEADRLRHASAEIPRSLLDREKSVLLQERAQQVENPPYGSLYERLQRELYLAGHPYHRSPMGSRSGLEAVTEADVNSYLETALSPSNAVLVIAGEFSPTDVKGPIDELFSPLGGPAAAASGGSAPVTEPSAVGRSEAFGSGRRRIRGPAPFARTLVAYPAPGEDSVDFPAASLLARTLGGGRGAPLVQSLVYDKRLAQEVSTGLVEMRHASTLVVDATAAPGVSTERLEDGVINALECCLADPVPEELLTASRHGAQRELMAEVDRLDSRAESLARSALAGRPLVGAGLGSQPSHRLTPRELTAFARRICRPEAQLVLSLEPSGGVP